MHEYVYHYLASQPRGIKKRANMIYIGNCGSKIYNESCSRPKIMISLVENKIKDNWAT